MRKKWANAVVGNTYVLDEIDKRTGKNVQRTVRHVDDYDVHYVKPLKNGTLSAHTCGIETWNKWVLKAKSVFSTERVGDC